MQIIPAIIPKSFQELEEKLEIIKGLVSFVHVDITDGKFGHDKSWPIEADKGEFAEILSQKRGLPFWEEMDYEIHLMTEDPISYAKEWVVAGASRIIFHVERLNYENDIQFLDQIKTEGLVEIGIAIDADTSVDTLHNYFEVADFIHVMTIPSIGAQGIAFDERGLEHIKWIKQNHPHLPVSADGSMNPETIPLAIEAGAERFVVGSYIFSNTNPRAAIEELQSL